MANRDLTAAQLRAYLAYDPDTGILRWLSGVHRRSIGRAAGGKNKTGHICLHLPEGHFYAHRLAWLHYHGEWPRWNVDHVNGDPSDNRMINLRDVPQCVNSQNRRRGERGKKYSDLLGVCWHKQRQKWLASISIGGKCKSLGLHDTPEEAHAAYVAAKRMYHAGCTI